MGTLGSAFFAGYVVTMMWLPRFADKKGRKPMYTLGMILNAVVYTVMMVQSNFYATWVCIFLFGCINSMRTAVGFIYLQEMIPARVQTSVTTLLFIIDGLVYTFQVIYYWQISKYSIYLLWTGYAIAVIGAVIPFFLPESPVFYLSLGRFDEMRAVMRRIARINKQEGQFE